MSTIHLLVNVTGKYEIELNIFDFGLVYNVSNVHNYINCGQYMFLAAKWIKKNCKTTISSLYALLSCQLISTYP
jgi:hypothetical protein